MIVFLQKYVAIARHTMWKCIQIGFQYHVCTKKCVPAAATDGALLKVKKHIRFVNLQNGIRYVSERLENVLNL